VSLLTADYDYPLPDDLIARYPLPNRADSRMMVLHRDGERIEHRMFREFPSFLREGDLVVLNDTRVLPARVFSDDGRIEMLFLEAVRENTWLDRGVTMFTMVGQAIPSFWLALILMIVLGLNLGILPISGTGTWQHFVMPGIVLAFTAIPALTRLTRSGMIEAMASDYIRTARAKGLSRARIIFKHALRNAAIPVVSIAAVQLGFMLGGSIVIETVFALHGVGYLGWESIAKNDFPVVQAVVLVLAAIYIGLTLLSDILNALLDPRLRTG
jgi:ABC-type dipeptide/oligopeptide/nickel transport system permease component